MDNQKSFKERRSYGRLLSIKMCRYYDYKLVLPGTICICCWSMILFNFLKDRGVKVYGEKPESLSLCYNQITLSRANTGSQGNYVLGFYPSLPERPSLAHFS